MRYYTVRQMAKDRGRAESTIRGWLRVGDRFPHAEKNGQWRIPQCCKDEHPNGVTAISEAAVAAAISVPGKL